MGYSIFQDTMVDMTYPQIEEAIENGACALLPISVVEEHGPHLCTGTDIYLTQKYSLQGTTQGRYLTGGVPPVRFSM